MHPDRPALAWTRAMIDAVDDAMLVLLSFRRRLAAGAGRVKRAAQLPASDPARERRVRQRAERLAARLDLPAPLAHALMDLAIADARHLQGLGTDLDHGGGQPPDGKIVPTMDQTPHSRTNRPRHPEGGRRWLRLLPPPQRWAPVFRAWPRDMQRRWLERAMARALAAPLADNAFSFLQDRRLGIEVTDLGLSWVVTLREGRLRAIEGSPEASVRGTVTDLLLLTSRLEDADTLFFQRRLVLTGDTELGLTARNVLDRLPWEQVPLALRILVNRGARMAQAARTSYRSVESAQGQGK